MNLSTASIPLSPIVLADRLITLAQDADRAGLHSTASDLVKLMYTVFDAPHPAPGFYAAQTRPTPHTHALSN